MRYFTSTNRATIATFVDHDESFSSEMPSMQSILDAFVACTGDNLSRVVSAWGDLAFHGHICSEDALCLSSNTISQIEGLYNFYLHVASSLNAEEELSSSITFSVFDLNTGKAFVWVHSVR